MTGFACNCIDRLQLRTFVAWSDQVNSSEMSETLAVSKPVLVVPTDQVSETTPHVQEERPMQKIGVTKN